MAGSLDPIPNELSPRLEISRALNLFTRKRLIGIGFLLLVISAMALHPATYKQSYPPGTLMWMGKDVVA